MKISIHCTCGQVYDSDMNAEFDAMLFGESAKVEICQCPYCKEQVRLKLGIDFVKNMKPGGPAY